MKGYEIRLVYFWLNSIDLAIERVGIRVSEGGHNIDNEVIKRRYVRGIRNLFEIYLPIVDKAIIFDNSFGTPEMVYQKTSGSETILNAIKFNEIKKFNKKSRQATMMKESMVII